MSHPAIGLVVRPPAAFDRHNEQRLCRASYGARVYDPEGVRGYVGRFLRLLDEAARQPDQGLSRLLESSKVSGLAPSS